MASKLLGIGIAALTGGAGGAGIAAASGTPLGKGLGMYKMGSDLSDKFSEEKPPDTSFQSNDPSNSTLGNNYSMNPDDSFGAMKRRKSILGGNW